jgi:hypothetical protein
MADLVAQVHEHKPNYILAGPEVGVKLKSSLLDCHEKLWGIPVFHLKCETRFLAACVAAPLGVVGDPYLNMAWLVDPVMKADLVTRMPSWSPYKPPSTKCVYKWDQDSAQNVQIAYEPIGNTGIWKPTWESPKNLDFGPLKAKLAAKGAAQEAQEAEVAETLYAPVLEKKLEKFLDTPEIDISEGTLEAPKMFVKKNVPYHAVVESDGTVKWGKDLTILEPTMALTATATTASFTNTEASNITITGTSNWDGTYVVSEKVQDGILLQGTPVKKSR